MKILTVCDQGNNRAVQFAHLLKYKYKADTIPVGINNTSQETLLMLFGWADVIVVTDAVLSDKIPEPYFSKMRVWDVGADHYPRPFNPELNNLTREMIERNPL